MATAYVSQTQHATEPLKKQASFLLVIAVFLYALTSADGHAQAVLPSTLYEAGMTQVEFSDPSDSGRSLNFMLIYPATPQRTAEPFKIFLFSNFAFV
jgi:hypothetical protein